MAKGLGRCRGGEPRAVIDCAVLAQKLFAISKYVPNLLKGGLCDRQVLSPQILNGSHGTKAEDREKSGL